MFPFTKFRRRFLAGTGLVIVLSGFSLFVVHTGGVRRLALAQVQVILRKTQGLQLDAGDLDYNLLTSRFELRRVALRGVRLTDLPAPFEAQRIVVFLPVWRLVQGSFETARIQIDGLSVHWTTGRDGRSNWPTFVTSGDSKPGGPAVIVTGGDFIVRNDPAQLLLHLQHGKITGSWDAVRQGYAIALETAGGNVEFEKKRLALDRLQLKSMVAGSGFTLESLSLVSGPSHAEARGAISGAPARIEASADLELDLPQMRQAIGITSPAKGQLLAQFKANGPLEGFQLNADLRGEGVVINGIPLRQPAAVALVDTGTGEVQVRDLSAGLLSGKLTGSGRIWTGPQRRQSEVKLNLTGIDSRQAAAIFGTSGFPSGRAAIQTTASWPGLDWNRSAISGSAQWKSLNVTFRAASAPGSLRASVDSKLGENSGMKGDIAVNLANQSLNGELHGDVVSLSRLGGQLEELLERPRGSFTDLGVDGNANWTVSIGGTAKSPTASLQLNAGGLSVGSWTGADLQLQADYSAQRIGLEQARVAWAGQQLTLSGEIGGTTAEAPLRLDGKIEGRSLAEMSKHLGIAGLAEGTLSGDLRIRGTVASPEAEATLRSARLSVFGERFSELSADARWQNGELTLNRFDAQQDSKSDEPGSIEASGSLNPGTGAYSIALVGQHLTPSAVVLPGGLATKGTFELEASGKGVLSDPAFNARLTGNGVRVGDADLGDLNATLDAAEHQATLRLAVPALKAEANSKVSMAGSWPFDLELKTQETRWPVTPAASFGASVRANGTLAPSQVERATATISNFRLEGPTPEVTGDGPIELSYADGQIQVGRLQLKSGASTLRLSGGLPMQDQTAGGSLALKGTLDLAQLSQWLPRDSKVQGTAEVEATVTGSAKNWQPAGSVTIRDGQFQWEPVPLRLENIAGRLQLADGVIRADELSADAAKGRVKVGGSLPLRLLSNVFPAPAAEAGQPARFSAQADGLQLTVGKGEHIITGSFGLKLTGEASSLSLDGLQAGVEFNQLEIKQHDDVVRQTVPTRLTLVGGVAKVEGLDLKGPQSSLSASGSIGLTGEFPVKLDAKGTINLERLAALTQSLEAAGTMRLDLHMSGPLESPKAQGGVAIEGGRLAVTDPQVQASDLALNAVLDGQRVTFQKLSGTLNGGTFNGGGTLDFGAKGIQGSNLFLTGKDIFLEFPASMKTTSSLDLKLLSRKEGLALEGRVEVQEGYYESPLESFSKSERLPESGPANANASGSIPIALDLRINTKRPLEMSNTLGTISATADLRVGGTVQSPRLLGNLQLEPDGKLYFGDRIYYIERGRVKFLDAARITPEFDIRAYTRASDYTVYLGLTGELDEVTTTFTSDPPLSRDDVIAVLLTGKTVAENRGVDVRSLEALSLAAGAMNASLSNKLHRTLGVSRVSIQPSAVAAESNPGARVTVTQDFTDAFRLMYSTNLSDSNDQIWVTEYDLSRRFTTRAVKQHDNTYRGEFRHDVRFGKASGPASESSRRPTLMVSKVQFVGETPFSQEVLAKQFKTKPGQKYKARKIRKDSERLTKFLAKNGYLESRVHMDRQDQGDNVELTVRIDLDSAVELSYEGASLPGKQQAQMRKVWQAGISDQQRPQAVKDAILSYFARKGYLQAKAEYKIADDGGVKRVRFALQPGPQYSGVRTIVEGASPERAEEILALLHDQELELSVRRDPRRAMEAIARFYRQRGYLAAKASRPKYELDTGRHTGRIVIPIEEGSLFHVGNLQFAGNQAITAEDLMKDLPLTTGTVFEPARVDPSLGALKVKYGKLGYRDAKFEYEMARNDERAVVDVSFRVQENSQTSIGTVTVEGTRQTKEKFVRDRLLVEEGELADTTKVRASMRNLSQTGAYSTADIQFRPPLESGASDKRGQVADLVVSVSEPKPYRLLYGGLYDSGNGPGFIADIQNQNSLGAGRTLGLRTRADSETDEFRLYLTQPFLHLRQISTTLSTYYTRETMDYQTTPTEKLGVSMQQDWMFRKKFLLSYGYRFERQRGFVPDPAAPDIPETVVSVAPITFTISREARDSFLDATRGSFISHGFELAPKLLGSDYPYVRYYLQYFKYFPLTHPRPVPYGEQPNRSRLVFATGYRMGLQKGFSQEGAVLTDRFYAGGGTTVRGFKQDELGPKLENGQPAGGNAVLVLNEELRFPVWKFFDAVSFVDVGNVFPRVSDFRLSELRAAGGIGLRIRNPFVVLRFDYGFKFDRRPGETMGAFFFSIGQAF